MYVRTFEQSSSAYPAEHQADLRALDTLSKAQRLARELRRQAEVAPRVRQARQGTANRTARLGNEDTRLDLERRIASHLPAGRLALSITDNRFTMISIRRSKGPLFHVRLHHMFLDAPPHLARALARYVAVNDPEASRLLGLFIESRKRWIRRGRRQPGPPIVIEPTGDVYDLKEVFDELNGRCFAGRIEAQITWGARNHRPRRRSSIKMGSYSVEDRLIRIHPALDRRFIPRYFLEWIVFHEMLHQVHDIPVVDGRRQFHTPQFVAQERRFEHYLRARTWERENLDRILTF